MKIFKALNTSVGKKIAMAITGLSLALFMVFHLIGNLNLFLGPEAFDGYVLKLKKLGFLIRIAEAGLLSFVLIHVYSGIVLWLKNKRAISKTPSYSITSTPRASRYTLLTGSFVFIFLVMHWSTFWYKFNFSKGNKTYYEIVLGPEVGFGNIYYTLFYIIAIGLLGYHLKHGFDSAGQTLAIKGTKYEKTYYSLAAVFWFWIPFGFISIPVYFGIILRLLG